MTVTAGDLIDAARDQHASFDYRRHPDPLLLRALSRYHRELCMKAVHAHETILAIVAPISLPLANFSAGITLPAYQYLHGGTVVPISGTDGSLPLTLVPWGNRFQDSRFPSAYVLKDVLYLRGVATDWGPYATINLFYTPIASELTALTDTLILPDTAIGACRDYLASFMANRGHADPSMPKLNAADFMARYLESEKLFLDDVFLQRGNEDNRIREVRSYT